MSGVQINIDKPRYDQSTFIGRAKHFFITTNPLNVLKTESQLNEAKSIVEAYRRGDDLKHLSEDELWRQKQIYDSAFHPDTGTLMFLPGRMSFQVPANMLITGCLVSFYKSTPAVIFWQWFNQTFNALVNFTNSSGDSGVSTKRLGTSYVLATTGALSTALFINKQVQRFPPIFARIVPFIAIIAANCINIPCMRSQEISEGIQLMDENGQKAGNSRKAAITGISQVVFSRIMMAAPSMVFPALVMDSLEKRGILPRIKRFAVPIQIAVVGLSLIFSTPLGCAIFPQTQSIEFKKLEETTQKEVIKNLGYEPKILYYNKGL